MIFTEQTVVHTRPMGPLVKRTFPRAVAVNGDQSNIALRPLAHLGNAQMRTGMSTRIAALTSAEWLIVRPV